MEKNSCWSIYEKKNEGYPYFLRGRLPEDVLEKISTYYPAAPYTVLKHGRIVHGCRSDLSAQVFIIDERLAEHTQIMRNLGWL